MMNIIVPIKMVPDLVEELSIGPSGKALDRMWLRMMINEFDDHAIEQAILLKERYGGTVIVLAPDIEGAEDALFTAAAKGADRLMKIIGDFEAEWNNHAFTRILSGMLQELNPDIVLTGVGAHDDIDGSLGPLLAYSLDLPYVGYVAGVNIEDGTALVRKEYPGGLIGMIEARLPAVLGIQASDQPPRYVAFSKIRQAMQSHQIEEISVGEPDLSGGAELERMFQPQTGDKATMIEGDAEAVAEQLADILREAGVI
jgi:electron transfer flavoprotein beta subunit